MDSSEAIVNPSSISNITFKTYTSESELASITKLMEADLSEPYSVYTYRYFINNWPQLCWMAMDNGECVGAVVCKVEHNKKNIYQGYIAMLAISATHRGKGLGTLLVEKAIQTMISYGSTQIYLETEVVNLGALRLYEKLGFIKTKRLFKYYLNDPRFKPETPEKTPELTSTGETTATTEAKTV